MARSRSRLRFFVFRGGARPAREADETGISIDTFRIGLEDRLRALLALSSLSSRAESELRFFLLFVLMMPRGGRFPVLNRPAAAIDLWVEL